MKIPKGWTVEPLSWGVEKLESGISEYGIDRFAKDGEPAVLRVSAVTSGIFLPENCKVLPPSIAPKMRTPVRGDCVLINRANGSANLVGISVYVSDPHPDRFLPDKIWQITARKDRSCGRYLGIITSTPRFREAVVNESSGGTGMRNIGSSRYLGIAVTFPPLPEQQKIADILSTWDKALEKLDALIAAKERRRQALMQQLLTGRCRLQGFSKPWTQTRFGDLMRSEDRYADFDDNHLYHLVSARRRAEGVFFREALYGRDIKTKVMKQVRAGDFVISRMQVVHGGLGVVPSECDGFYASDSYEVLVPCDPAKLSSRFIGHLCCTRRFWHHALVCSHGVHIEKMTFVISDFEYEKFMIPELAEQVAIADILDTADSELRVHRQQRTSIDHQKRGLMQQLLTGKVSVSL